MIDIKLLREQPDLVRAAIAKKKFACDLDAHTGDGSINTDVPITVRALKSKNALCT